MPSTAAMWHGVSPCLAVVVGERSVNLSSHLCNGRSGKIGMSCCTNSMPKGGGAGASRVKTLWINPNVLLDNVRLYLAHATFSIVIYFSVFSFSFLINLCKQFAPRYILEIESHLIVSTLFPCTARCSGVAPFTSRDGTPSSVWTV